MNKKLKKLYIKVYKKNRAAKVVTIKPRITGLKFRFASSKGDTLHIAETGIIAQGISVPPPTQIAPNWPRAVKVAMLPPVAVPNRFAVDPARAIPENPEPSRPVMAPTVVTPKALNTLFNGTALEKANPKSFTIPKEPVGK